MRTTASLRGRLTAIILGPLVILALALGAWAISDAQTRAEDRFDRALLSAALAVSRDVALSGGDALSTETTALLTDSFAGPVFYHVFAPDGAFVTGYATPPVPDTLPNLDQGGQTAFEGIHQSRPVRAIRYTDAMQIDGLAGEFTVTVWQELSYHNATVRELVQVTLGVIALLVIAVAFVVWFGVSYGLRPLNDLEEAIGRRSSDELSTIRRAVPDEVKGIVRTLNSLFVQLDASMQAQAAFISNAAHQLRNPISGVLSLAEAVVAAPGAEEAQHRAKDLLAAARDTSELTNKLLLLERAKAISPEALRTELDLSQIVQDWIEDQQGQLSADVVLKGDINPGLLVHGDPLMLREAMQNLFDNALHHGGPDVSVVTVACLREAGDVVLSVQDDGVGMAAEDLPRALQRFELVGPTSRTGLGVSIVAAIAAGHGGRLDLSSEGTGFTAMVRLPLSGKSYPTQK